MDLGLMRLKISTFAACFVVKHLCYICAHEMQWLVLYNTDSEERYLRWLWHWTHTWFLSKWQASLSSESCVAKQENQRMLETISYCIQLWLELCSTSRKNILSHVTALTNGCVRLCNIILWKFLNKWCQEVCVQKVCVKTSCPEFLFVLFVIPSRQMFE